MDEVMEKHIKGVRSLNKGMKKHDPNYKDQRFHGPNLKGFILEDDDVDSHEKGGSRPDGNDSDGSDSAKTFEEKPDAERQKADGHNLGK